MSGEHDPYPINRTRVISLRCETTSPDTELFCLLCQVLDQYSLPIAVRVAILRAVSDIQR